MMSVAASCRAALLGTVLIFLGSCPPLRAQEPAGATTPTTDSQLVLPAMDGAGRRFLGRTFCQDNIPVSVVDSTLDPYTRRDVEAHEAAHRRRLQGNCKALLNQTFFNQAVALDYEAEGYCAGLATWGLSEGAWMREVEFLEGELAAVYLDVPREKVLAAVTQYCRIPGS